MIKDDLPIANIKDKVYEYLSKKKKLELLLIVPRSELEYEISEFIKLL